VKICTDPNLRLDVSVSQIQTSLKTKVMKSGSGRCSPNFKLLISFAKSCQNE
jgi:hypothetical protein